MDKKLRRLREHMDQTVLKDVDFSDSSKEKVRKAVRAQTDNPSKRPWIYQLKNGLSVAVCLLLLFGGIVYAIQQQNQNSASTRKQAKLEAAQQDSASKANANSHHNGANHHTNNKAATKHNSISSTSNKVNHTMNAKNTKNSNNNAKSNAPNANPTYLIRMMSGGSGWRLSKNNVLHTSDGGKQWNLVSPRGGNPKFVNSAFFLNQSYAWITAVYPDGSTIQFHTTNGGQSWASSNSKVPAGGMMDFINKSDGWILKKYNQGKVKDSVEIYRTQNSGQTWDPMAKTNNQGQLPSSGKVTGIGFARSPVGIGWLSGYEPHTSGHLWLYKTTDYGKTWNTDSVSLKPQWQNNQIKTFPPMFLGGSTLLPVTMADPKTGELNRIAFFQDDNGNWSLKGTQSIQSSQVVYDFSDQKHGWVITDQAVYQTNDGTGTWSKITPGSILKSIMATGKAEELDIYSQSTARLLVKMKDGSTRLLITYDGGKRWHLSSK